MSGDIFLRKLIRQYITSTDGSNLIEFAFVAPVFLLILIELFDLGCMMIVQNALDAGARAASRFGLTGANAGIARDQAIKNEVIATVASYSGGIVKPDGIQIVVESYPALTALNQPEPFVDANGNGKYDVGEFYVDVNGNGKWDGDQGTVGSFGTGGQAVKYTVGYDWNSFLAIFGFPKTIHISGTATVQNESFK
jgi:hypothetical protein